jgi:hypothetical protein
MKSLISPNEPRETGYRVADVVSDDKVFGVASPLFWVTCADDVVADQFWYDPETQTIKALPEPEPESDGPTGK